MFCKKCGKQIDDDSIFCNFCGTNLKSVQTNDEIIKDDRIKMLEFSQAKNDKYKITMPINSMYVGISESLEKYNIIYKKSKEISNICSKHFRELYDYEVKNIDDVISKVPDIFESELSIVISGAVSVLVNMGINEYNESNFIDTYSRYFDYSQYFDEALAAYNRVYQFEDWQSDFRSAQRGSRSNWQGGGFGISGAIKGAVTAGLINSAMGILRSIGDRRVNTKDNEQLSKLKKDIMFTYPIRERLSQGMLDCCDAIFKAVFDLLDKYRIIKNINIDEVKANAIFDNTITYEEDDTKYYKNLMKCIELNPYDGRFYCALASSYGDTNNDIENLADFFSYKQLVRQIKYETIDSLREDNHDLEEIRQLAIFLGLQDEVQKVDMEIKEDQEIESSEFVLYNLLKNKSLSEQIEYAKKTVCKDEIDNLYKAKDLNKIWSLALSGYVYAEYLLSIHYNENENNHDKYLQELKSKSRSGNKLADLFILDCKTSYAWRKEFDNNTKLSAKEEIIQFAINNKIIYARSIAGYILKSKDKKMAYKYLKSSAEQMCPMALAWLGDMYRNGHYVEKNTEVARICLICAATLGHYGAKRDCNMYFGIKIK